MSSYLGQIRRRKVKYTVKHINYFGLNHEVINKKFEGNLTYIGDLCTNEGKTAAVYHATKPNKSKGHKEFMLLQVFGKSGNVSGMDKKTLEKHAKHDAILCTECNTVLYSVHRHDFHSCSCPNETFVDGGKDYLRAGGVSRDKMVSGTFNLITGKFRKRPKKA